MHMLTQTRTAVARAVPQIPQSLTGKTAGFTMDYVAAHGLPQSPAQVRALREEVSSQLGQHAGLAVPYAGPGVEVALGAVARGIIDDPNPRPGGEERAHRAEITLQSIDAQQMIDKDRLTGAGLNPQAQAYPERTAAPAGAIHPERQTRAPIAFDASGQPVVTAESAAATQEASSPAGSQQGQEAPAGERRAPMTKEERDAVLEAAGVTAADRAALDERSRAGWNRVSPLDSPQAPVYQYDAADVADGVSTESEGPEF